MRMVLPVSSFDAISQKPNQIFMTHMPNSFNLHTEFLLCLSPKQTNFNINFTKPTNNKKTKKLCLSLIKSRLFLFGMF